MRADGPGGHAERVGEEVSNGRWGEEEVCQQGSRERKRTRGCAQRWVLQMCGSKYECQGRARFQGVLYRDPPGYSRGVAIRT